MARGNALSDEQNASLRALAHALLARHDGSRTALARVVGVSQPALSNFLNGASGAGTAMAHGLARAASISVDAALAYGGAALPSDAVSHAIDAAAREPRFCDRPGWSVAISRAKAAAPEMPDWVWSQIAESRGFPATPLTTVYLVRLAEVVRDCSVPS